MKKLIYLFIPVMMLAFAGCDDDLNIAIPEDFDKAEITGAAIYREAVEGDSEFAKKQAFVSVASAIVIDKEAHIATVKLTKAGDLAQLKVTLTISSGATVENPLGTQIQDFTASRSISIVSPSGAVKNEWVLEIVNP
jgi:hypothetical protein